MQSRICGIYKITSPTGRLYIGQSLNVRKRFRDYQNMNSKTKSQIKLWRSFLKHGTLSHSFEIIEQCSAEELNTKERYWQDFYDVLNGGLNCLLQDSKEKRRVLSEETKEKIRQTNIGRPVSLKVRNKLSRRMKGNTYSLGRIRSTAEKNKISETMKSISKGRDNNMFGKLGENNPNSKIILHKDLGIFYFGVRNAAKALNLSYSSLKKIMCGSRKNNTPFVYV